ncbi:RNA-binding S4 domain-containing protein [Klebsiella pneumoniae]|uniref:RNA-binding S4 domain-containing protein n=1 Tax=Klebsiella pneumoniae TaxID=573 RepID=A0A2X3CJ62_KLEPN|nr:RNA-binding S4 domain-containing protein [Klebsiella pneumoniae]
MLTLRQGNDERTVAHYRHYRTAPPGQAKPSTCMKRRWRVSRSVKKMALARKMNALTMPHPDRRPDKKERRDLMRFKHGESE